jgi:hypothetical protein
MTWRHSASVLLAAVCGLMGQPAAGKLEPPLQALYDAWRAKGAHGLTAEASARGVALRGGRVSVRVSGTDEDVPRLRRTVVRSGGRVISEHGSSLFVEIAVSRLRVMAAEPQVLAIYIDRAQRLGPKED